MGSRDDPTIRRAYVDASDPRDALARLAAALAGPRDPALVVVFASCRLDPDAVAAALADALPGVPTLGCTSHGELHGGDREHTIVGLAIASPSLRVGLGLATDLERSALRSSRAAVIDAARQLGHEPELLLPGRHVGLAVVDGRSGFEESFCLGSAATAPQIKFVGGSASDAFEEPRRACVFFGGRAHRNAGVVAILETTLPFAVIETEHMVPTEARVVVTGADPERRRVTELDGRPAARRYAELIRAHGGPALDALVASSFPFALYVAGRPYVRSVADLDGDALVFASAVDPGTILRLMRPGDLVGTTRRALADAAGAVGGDLRAVVAFSCLGRHREALHSDARDELAAVYAAAPLTGFHSFGEQVGPLLVNHALTGLALGAARG